jgi:hypothetical protein
MAADFGAKLDVDEETGFVTLTVAGRSVTKRGLTMFTFDDLPPSHLRVVPKPAHVRDRPPRERRAAAR